MSGKDKVRRDALLNGRQCAEAIGIAVQSFGKWGVEPYAKDGRENLYRLKDVLEVYRRRVERELRPKIEREVEARMADLPPDADPIRIKLQLDVERKRLTAAQADAQEEKNKMLRHEIAPFTFFTFTLGKVANSIAGVMDSMPTELMRRLKLTPQQVEKVKVVTSAAADDIAALGDEEWVAARYDEFLEEADQ